MDDNKHWRKNLWILLFGTFLTGIAFSEVIPFQPLYISELGDFSKSQLSLLSGIVYASSFIVVIFTICGSSWTKENGVTNIIRFSCNVILNGFLYQCLGTSNPKVFTRIL